MLVQVMVVVVEMVVNVEVLVIELLVMVSDRLGDISRVVVVIKFISHTCNINLHIA